MGQAAEEGSQGVRAMEGTATNPIYSGKQHQGGSSVGKAPAL